MTVWETSHVRIFIWLGAVIVLGVISSFIAWGVEYATDSIFWMLLVGGVVFIAGLVVIVKLFLRQDDLDY
ncbi:MAG: hypothetical protein RL238_2415 [Actinomycetota bacterium]